MQRGKKSDTRKSNKLQRNRSTAKITTEKVCFSKKDTKAQNFTRKRNDKHQRKLLNERPKQKTDYPVLHSQGRHTRADVIVRFPFSSFFTKQSGAEDLHHLFSLAPRENSGSRMSAKGGAFPGLNRGLGKPKTVSFIVLLFNLNHIFRRRCATPCRNDLGGDGM